MPVGVQFCSTTFPAKRQRNGWTGNFGSQLSLHAPSCTIVVRPGVGDISSCATHASPRKKTSHVIHIYVSRSQLIRYMSPALVTDMSELSNQALPRVSIPRHPHTSLPLYPTVPIAICHIPPIVTSFPTLHHHVIQLATQNMPRCHPGLIGICHRLTPFPLKLHFDP